MEHFVSIPSPSALEFYDQNFMLFYLEVLETPYKTILFTMHLQPSKTIMAPFLSPFFQQERGGVPLFFDFWEGLGSLPIGVRDPT